MKKNGIYILTVILTVFLSFALGGCEWLFSGKKDTMYQITFVYDNGDPNTVINVKSGESVYAPPSPKKDGWVFSAWYADANFTLRFVDGTAASSNLTLYAYYAKIYHISGGVYDYTSGLPVAGCFVGGTGGYPSGTRVTLSAELADGYVFEGFYLNGERFSSSLTVSLTVGADAVYDVKVRKGVYIRAEVGDVEGGRVTINDAEVPSWSTIDGGRAVVKAEAFLGYRFAGFYDADDILYTEEAQFEIVLNDDAFFTAKFAYIEYTIEVASSDEELGTVSLSPIQSVYLVTDTVTITSVPVEDKIFKGLFVDIDGVAVFVSSSLTANINLIDLVERTDGTEEFKIVAEFEATDSSSGYYNYQRVGDGVRITGINKPFETGNVVVPSVIVSGPDEYPVEYPVTQISYLAFAGRDDVIKLSLPSSLRAFTGTTNPFEYCKNLVSISVGTDNAYFSSYGGVLFSKSGATLISYPCAKPDLDYTPPASVTRIGASAFGGQEFLENFSAAGLLEVSAHAFRNSSVKTFSASGSPSSFLVGEFAFLNCVNLSSAAINFSGTGSGRYEISRFAFSGCEKLSSVVLNGIKTLNEEIFSGCSSLAEITLPKTLATLTGDVFGGAGLVNIYVDENSAAFEDVDGVLYSKSGKSLVRCPEMHINSVGVKAGTLSIAGYAFKNASLVTSVDLADASVAEIGAEAFMNASSIDTFNMGTKVKTIGGYAFFGCSALIALTVSPTLETVGEYAFSGAGIAVLDMGNSLKKAAATAFNNMRELTEIYFPNTVTDLGDRYGNIDGELPIFVNCPKLLEINVAEGGVTIYTSSGADEGNSSGILYKGTRSGTGASAVFVEREMIVRCPEGKTGSVTLKSKEMQKVASGAFSNARVSNVWFNFDGALSQKLTVIGRQAFSFAESLTEIALPASITRIGDDAFLGCKSLANVLLPYDLQRIGDFAFSGCAFEEITIYESIQYVYAFAFYGNPNLRRVYMRKTTAPSTSIFRSKASIFDGHNAAFFKIYIMKSDSGNGTWSSNISNYTKATGWSEYIGSYEDWEPPY